MRRRNLMLGVAALTLALPNFALADSRLFTRPNVIDTLDPITARLNGGIFVDLGLVGTVRLPANILDSTGQTIGGFSGLSIDLSTWRHSAVGYRGVITALSGPASLGGPTTLDYAARLERLNFTFNPYTGTTDLASTTQQGTLTPAGATVLRDLTGQVFTSRDPLNGGLSRGGTIYPSPPPGDPASGKVSLHAGGLSVLRDGSFYVSDEYGPNIYYFNASGQQVGTILAPADIQPRIGSTPFFGPTDIFSAGTITGRRSDQGFEGVSMSPDGSRLFAVLQSATLQDNPTGLAVQRNNTRVLVYDTSASKTPTAPLSEYVLQLPTYINSLTGVGNTTTALKTGATAGATDILALNKTQFLVIAQDQNGRGGNANAIAFKSILLVDTTGATNLIGTPFAGTTPISTAAATNNTGALDPSITPVQQVELVTMLNVSQLQRFGLNLTTAPSTQYTLSNNWKALGLAPVLEEAKPHDFFLLVANDNGFQTQSLTAGGVTNADNSLTNSTSGTGENDNVIMFYRLTLPTYIDPQALAYLQDALPVALGNARAVSAAMGATPVTAGLSHLSAARRAHYAGVDVDGVSYWAQGGAERVAGSPDVDSLQGANFALGRESGEDGIRFGFSLTGTQLNGSAVNGFNLDGKAYGFAGYGAWFGESGVYVQAAAGFSETKLTMTRPAAYGQTASSSPPANSIDLDLEFGYATKLGRFEVGPFVEVSRNHTVVNSFSESGASVSNGQSKNVDYVRSDATIGGEAVFNGPGVRPSIRIGYTFVKEGGNNNADIQLIGLDNSALSVALPKFAKGFVTAEAALEGQIIGIDWRAAVNVQGAQGGATGQLIFGLSKTFN